MVLTDHHVDVLIPLIRILVGSIGLFDLLPSLRLCLTQLALNLSHALFILSLGFTKFQAKHFSVAHELCSQLIKLVFEVGALSLELLVELLDAGCSVRLDLVQINLHAVSHVFNLSLRTGLSVVDDLACLLVVLVDAATLLLQLVGERALTSFALADEGLESLCESALLLAVFIVTEIEVLCEILAFLVERTLQVMHALRLLRQLLRQLVQTLLNSLRYNWLLLAQERSKLLLIQYIQCGHLRHGGVCRPIGALGLLDERLSLKAHNSKLKLLNFVLLSLIVLLQGSNLLREQEHVTLLLVTPDKGRRQYFFGRERRRHEGLLSRLRAHTGRHLFSGAYLALP